MYRGHHLAVVIPAFEESLNIANTLRTVPRYVDRIIVVDDGSCDNTSIIAQDCDPRVEVICHQENQGVGAAISSGYRHALTDTADIVVVMGADGQMEPEEMPKLLDPLVDGAADYVKGERFGHPDILRRMPFIRYIGTLALTHATRWATGYGHLRDAQCGYTAISRDILSRLPTESLYPRYGFPNDLLVKLSRLQTRVHQTTVTPIYGKNTSKMRIREVVLPLASLLLKAIWKRWRRHLERARVRDKHPHVRDVIG